MNISLICVGKIKENYLKEAIIEYNGKLSKSVGFAMTEVEDEKAPENLSEALMEQIMQREGQSILRYVKDNYYVITLEILGNELSTENFRKKLDQIQNMGKEDICFIIGGSLGLSEAVKKRSDYKLSFSRMTFPHQLMRVILLEQLDLVLKKG